MHNQHCQLLRLVIRAPGRASHPLAYCRSLLVRCRTSADQVSVSTAAASTDAMCGVRRPTACRGRFTVGVSSVRRARMSDAFGCRRYHPRRRSSLRHYGPMDYRIEHDTMGEVRVPAAALWRAQTQRAVENFPISGTGLDPAHIAALPGSKRPPPPSTRELGVVAGRCRDRDRGPPPAEVAAASTTTSFRSTSSRPAPAPRRT